MNSVIVTASFIVLYVVINSENVRVDRIEPSNDLVYVAYNLVNEDENYYSVNAQIPVFNINTDIAKNINPIANTSPIGVRISFFFIFSQPIQ